jgi:hypothetical protein
VDERFDGHREEVLSSATVAGAGAVLVGVGVALAYLLSKRRHPTLRAITLDADLIVDANGCVKQDPERIEIEIDEANPNTVFFVRWSISGSGSNNRWVSFEDFKRKIQFQNGSEGDSEPVTPLELEHGNRCAHHVADTRVMRRRIARQAIRDVARQSTHVYKWDVWLDRRKSADPEIAIIRR